MMRVHWFYASHDQDTSLIYAKKREQAAKGKGKGRAAVVRTSSDGEGEEQEAMPPKKKGMVYRMGEMTGRMMVAGQGQPVRLFRLDACACLRRCS